MSEKLPSPIKQALREEAPSAADIERMWGGVESRLRRPRRRWVWVAAPALGLAAAAIALVLVGRGRVVDGPVTLAGGAGLEAAVEATGAPRTLAFSDGAEIALEPGAALERLANDERAIDLLVRRGRATFTVGGKGRRRWTVEAGVVSVQTSGARFAVWRSETGVEVHVFSGEVVLRGAEVPGHVQRLGAGGTLRVAASDETAHAPTPATPTTPTTPTTPQADALEALLARADAARLAGEPARAAAILDEAVGAHAGDGRAAIAAFTRARILADDLKQPRDAAEAFARAIAFGLPDALVETAFARLVETRRASGDDAGAATAAATYRQRFPHGREAARIERLLSPP